MTVPMPTLRLTNLRRELLTKQLNNDNLHRIAISNIRDPLKSLERWWRDKYRQPPKDVSEYTPEELLVEYLEEFYAENPVEIDRFFESEKMRDQDGWDGKHTPELEQQMQSRLKKINASDPDIIEKYKTYGDEEMSSEQFSELFDKLGRDLPGSKNTRQLGDSQTIEDEFNDTF